MFVAFGAEKKLKALGYWSSFICVIKVALLRNIILIILFEFSQISWYFERETMGFNDELKTAIKKKNPWCGEQLWKKRRMYLLTIKAMNKHKGYSRQRRQRTKNRALLADITAVITTNIITAKDPTAKSDKARFSRWHYPEILWHWRGFPNSSGDKNIFHCCYGCGKQSQNCHNQNKRPMKVTKVWWYL